MSRPRLSLAECLLCKVKIAQDAAVWDVRSMHIFEEQPDTSAEQEGSGSFSSSCEFFVLPFSGLCAHPILSRFYAKLQQTPLYGPPITRERGMEENKAVRRHTE